MLNAFELIERPRKPPRLQVQLADIVGPDGQRMKRIIPSHGYEIERVVLHDVDYEAQRYKASIICQRARGRPPLVPDDWEWTQHQEVITRRVVGADGRITFVKQAKPGYRIVGVYATNEDPVTRRAEYGIITARRRKPPDGDGEPSLVPEQEAA